MLSPSVALLQMFLLFVLETEASPLQIQTFLVETNTSVLCKEGVCISEDPEKDKCPVDFFEVECPGYEEYCGLSSHRGKWMLLFCKHTCHCAAAEGGDDCCHQDKEEHTSVEDNSNDNDTVMKNHDDKEYDGNILTWRKMNQNTNQTR